VVPPNFSGKQKPDSLP